MYWLDASARDGWMGLKIYLQVRMRRLRYGSGPVTITITGDGIELRPAPPDLTLVSKTIIALARDGPRNTRVITADWLSHLNVAGIPWDDGESRWSALWEYLLRSEPSRIKDRRIEHDFKCQIAKPAPTPGVVVLERIDDGGPIAAHVLTAIAWRCHQIKRLLGGWRLPQRTAPASR